MAENPQDTERFGETGTPEERRASRVLMDALAARRADLGGAAGLPEDRALSERILDEARRRSELISGSRNPAASSRTISQGERIPWWLWLAWVVAIGGAVAAFFYFS